MEETKTIPDLQILTGRLATLRKFISRSASKTLSFIQVLQGSKNFEWWVNYQKAFE